MECERTRDPSSMRYWRIGGWLHCKVRVVSCPLHTRDVPRSSGRTVSTGTHFFRTQGVDVWKISLCPHRRIQPPRRSQRLHRRRRLRGRHRMYIRFKVTLSIKHLVDIHSTVTDGRGDLSPRQIAGPTCRSRCTRQSPVGSRAMSIRERYRRQHVPG